MAKVIVFLADGFEDIEALIPVDVLRRGGVKVEIVSATYDTLVVKSAHDVAVYADFMAEDGFLTEADMLVLPGGMPGASNLYKHHLVCEAVKYYVEHGRRVAAICASPAVVLAPIGVLKGRRATCYPGFEQQLRQHGATYTAELVTVDGNITTAEGPAAALPFAYELLAQLTSKEQADQVAEAMRYKHLMGA